MSGSSTDHGVRFPIAIGKSGQASGPLLLAGKRTACPVTATEEDGLDWPDHPVPMGSADFSDAISDAKIGVGVAEMH